MKRIRSTPEMSRAIRMDPVPTSPATVLIVDDEGQICDLLGQALANEGYQVRTARSGAEAMRIASAPLRAVRTW